MRHSTAVGVCLAIAVFAPGCPKDDNSGSSASSQDGGSSSSGGSGGQQQMSGAGHGGDTSHSGTGGRSTGSGGTNGGSTMHSGTGGGGSVGHDAGTAHDAGQTMRDSGSSIGPEKDAGAGSGDDCDLKCDQGSHCELVQVQCIRAPCPPQKECVPDEEKKSCGGFAGFPCPGGGTCVDDPSDDCDPMHGGADCGGICVCDKAASCVQGKHWDGRPSVCDCVSDI
jgi:hypothetical protein